MKVLVTGATGFVGSHLCAHLIGRGHLVTAVVRRAGTAPEACTEVVQSDIGPLTDWRRMLSGHDAIIHLAARAHVMNDKAENPLAEFRRVNTTGTEVLARAAAAQGVSRFVFLSTIKVNGEETLDNPFTAQSKANPVDPYGISKYEAELAVRTEARDAGMEVVIVRSPLVYGPNVRGNFLRILRLVRKQIPLPLASVSNHRSMVSIWNLVDLIEKATSEPGAAGIVVAAGDDVSPSTPELLRTLSAAMGMRSRLFACPVTLLTMAGRLVGQGATVQRLVASLEVLPGSDSVSWSWAPVITLQDGLNRTASWFQSQHNKEAEK